MERGARLQRDPYGFHGAWAGGKCVYALHQWEKREKWTDGYMSGCAREQTCVETRVYSGVWPCQFVLARGNRLLNFQEFCYIFLSSTPLRLFTCIVSVQGK